VASHLGSQTMTPQKLLFRLLAMQAHAIDGQPFLGNVDGFYEINDRRTAGFPNNVERPGLEGKATT
jgi:hypothetical protein